MGRRVLEKQRTGWVQSTVESGKALFLKVLYMLDWKFQTLCTNLKCRKINKQNCIDCVWLYKQTKNEKKCCISQLVVYSFIDKKSLIIIESEGTVFL